MWHWREKEDNTIVQTLTLTILCALYSNVSSRKILITRPLLQETARLMAKKCNNDTFTASYGWLESFIKRHNIVFGSTTSEHCDVDLTKVTDWKITEGLCCGYGKANVFNMDETGLFFLDTKKSFHVKGKSRHFYFHLFCSNQLLNF